MFKSSFIRQTATFILLSATVPAWAQSDVSEVIKSSPADATALVQAYLNPLFKGFGTGINSGWNTTANAKNALRFDVRVGLSGAIVPDKDKNFDVTRIGLSNNLRPTNTAQVISPTFAGEDRGGVGMTVYDNNGTALESFNLPEGSGFGIVPSPMIQATVGLPKGIDVTLRTSPKINLGDDLGSLSMFGGGVKVEVLRLLSKTADRLLPIDLAVAIGYTQFNYDVPLELSAPSNADPASAGQPTDFSNQRIEAKFSGVNTELILSKKLLIFTPFVSVGYNNAKTNVGLLGNYPVITGFNAGTGRRTYSVYTNPIQIDQTDISGFRSNIGFQLNLAFLRLFASYSTGEYNSFNGGIGLGLGK